MDHNFVGLTSTNPPAGQRGKGPRGVGGVWSPDKSNTVMVDRLKQLISRQNSDDEATRLGFSTICRVLHFHIELHLSSPPAERLSPPEGRHIYFEVLPFSRSPPFRGVFELQHHYVLSVEDLTQLMKSEYHQSHHPV